MHLMRLAAGYVALMVTASARFLPDQPPATHVDASLGGRQEPTATTMEFPAVMTEDPWQCVTENITQYFLDVPQPTGDVLSAMETYGYDAAAPCRATDTRSNRLCIITEPQVWCGFTTAAEPEVLSDYYATFVPAAVSFWQAKGSTISILSTSCPVAWGRPHAGQHEWLRIARAHADCYLEALTLGPTSTSSLPIETTGLATTTSSGNLESKPTAIPESTPTANSEPISRGSPNLETLAWMSAGLAVFANAA